MVSGWVSPSGNLKIFHRSTVSNFYQRFDTENEYRAALLKVIAEAQSTIRIFDHDLQRMALHTPDASESLKAFLRTDAKRRIDIAVHDFSFIQRNASRLMRLLDKHPQTIQIRLIPESLHHLADSHLLADRKHGTRRFHRDFPRGSLLVENPDEIAPWWDRFDQIWELCLPIDSQNKAVF